MFLINWVEANALMIFTTLALIGIPAVMLYIAFGKHKGASADKDKYLNNQGE